MLLLPLCLCFENYFMVFFLIIFPEVSSLNPDKKGNRGLSTLRIPFHPSHMLYFFLYDFGLDRQGAGMCLIPSFPWFSQLFPSSWSVRTGNHFPSFFCPALEKIPFCKVVWSNWQGVPLGILNGRKMIRKLTQPPFLSRKTLVFTIALLKTLAFSQDGPHWALPVCSRAVTAPIPPWHFSNP